MAVEEGNIYGRRQQRLVEYKDQNHAEIEFASVRFGLPVTEAVPKQVPQRGRIYESGAPAENRTRT